MAVGFLGIARLATTLGLLVALGACGYLGIGSDDAGSNAEARSAADEQRAQQAGLLAGETQTPRRPETANPAVAGAVDSGRSTFWDLFSNNDNPNTTVSVNKYLWNASLDVLNFLPIESADPFSGVIVTGYGTPPGGGRAYRATIYVQDPALDARSLKIALATQSGPVDADTVRAVEDAILTRARQLRVRDGAL